MCLICQGKDKLLCQNLYQKEGGSTLLSCYSNMTLTLWLLQWKFIIILFQYLPCTRHCSKNIVCNDRFNPRYNPRCWVFLQLCFTGGLTNAVKLKVSAQDHTDNNGERQKVTSLVWASIAWSHVVLDIH